MRLRHLTALAATAASLAAAPAALAQTSTVGSTNGTPTMNICVLGFNCTYLNAQNGKPTDVVKRSGTITSWSLNAGSVGGQVRIRVLRPVAGGELQGDPLERPADRDGHRRQHLPGAPRGQAGRRPRAEQRLERHLHGPDRRGLGGQLLLEPL